MTGLTRLRPGLDLGDVVARATLVIAPLLAFDAFHLPGIATLAMVMPLVVLGLFYVTTAGNRFPAWEFLLVALLCLSVIWGDDPTYTVERLRTYVPLVLATVVAGSLVSGATVLRCLQVSIVVTIVSSLVAIALNPSGSVRLRYADEALTGQFSKNVYGGLLVIALLLLLERRRRLNLVLAPVLLVLLVLNRSATAWVVATLLVVATYASRSLISRLGPRASKPVLAVMVAAGVSGIAMIVLSDLTGALAALGKDPTLGRRTEIWAASWEQVKSAPLLGHGAFTFLDPASNSPVTQYVWRRFQNYRPPHPHNGFLDLTGQLGVVGLLVFAGLVVHGLRRGARHALRGSDSARTATLVLAFIVLSGATEPTYLGPWLVVTVMCVAVAGGERENGQMPGGTTSAGQQHGALSGVTS